MEDKKAFIKFIIIIVLVVIVVLSLPYWILYKFFGGWISTTVKFNKLIKKIKDNHICLPLDSETFYKIQCIQKLRIHPKKDARSLNFKSDCSEPSKKCSGFKQSNETLRDWKNSNSSKESKKPKNVV